jgi:hypothetical protein
MCLLPEHVGNNFFLYSVRRPTSKSNADSKSTQNRFFLDFLTFHKSSSLPVTLPTIHYIRIIYSLYKNGLMIIF